VFTCLFNDYLSAKIIQRSTCQHAGALPTTSCTSPTPRRRTVTSKFSSYINSRSCSRPAKRKSLLCCVYPLCEVVSEEFKRIGNRCNFRTILGVHTRQPGREEIRSKWHSVYSIPSKWAETTLAKQADLWPYVCVNTVIFPKRVF
jgi:hypothetical protein